MDYDKDSVQIPPNDGTLLSAQQLVDRINPEVADEKAVTVASFYDKTCLVLRTHSVDSRSSTTSSTILQPPTLPQPSGDVGTSKAVKRKRNIVSNDESRASSLLSILRRLLMMPQANSQFLPLFLKSQAFQNALNSKKKKRKKSSQLAKIWKVGDPIDICSSV
jgi:hypothetical protein